MLNQNASNKKTMPGFIKEALLYWANKETPYPWFPLSRNLRRKNLCNNENQNNKAEGQRKSKGILGYIRKERVEFITEVAGGNEKTRN